MIELSFFKLALSLIMFFFCGVSIGSRGNSKIQLVSVICWFICWIAFIILFIICGWE